MPTFMGKKIRNMPNSELDRRIEANEKMLHYWEHQEEEVPEMGHTRSRATKRLLTTLRNVRDARFTSEDEY